MQEDGSHGVQDGSQHGDQLLMVTSGEPQPSLGLGHPVFSGLSHAKAQVGRGFVVGKASALLAVRWKEGSPTLRLSLEQARQPGILMLAARFHHARSQGI